jgi:glucosamine--fructose-6-phosphate aminotransferase (isomerizing)
MSNGTHTWQEVISQPQVWESTLAAFDANRVALGGFLDRYDFDQILVVGCGSTHYLAQTAAATLMRRAGIPSQALPASELWLFPAAFASRRTLLLSVSRSGTTTETLWALEQFREAGGGPVLAVTCYPESTLAQRADFALVAPDAQEESVAQTRSFTSMLLLTQALAAVLAGDEGMLERLGRLPQALEAVIERVGELPRRLGEDGSIKRLFFLGGGPLYGLASEAMLKTKEMSLSYAEAYYPLEFRHGPMSMVDDHTMVVGFLSDTGLAQELQVLRDMQALGGRTLAFVEDGAAISGWQSDYVVELDSGLDEWERGPLYLPAVQRMAFYRSLHKGLNPDQPTNLTAVVNLEMDR